MGIHPVNYPTLLVGLKGPYLYAPATECHADHSIIVCFLLWATVSALCRADFDSVFIVCILSDWFIVGCQFIFV